MRLPVGYLAVFTVAALIGLAALPKGGAQAAQNPLAESLSATPQHLATESLQVRSSNGVHKYREQYAFDDATREKGLMYRSSLGADEGMIFDFYTPQPVAFWMHNTWIGLDILYIDASGRVLNIAKHAKPMDDTALPSSGPARSVLEIAAGLSDRLGIKPGDKVTDERIYPQKP